MKKLLCITATLVSLSCFSQSYIKLNIVTGLSNPVAFDIAPDGRFFITQKGCISGSAIDAIIKVYSSGGTLIGDFYDLSDSTQCDFERGLLGIELDPDFTNNHYVYVYYNHLFNNDERIRVVRFTESNNIGTNPTILFDLDVAENIAGNHVGGNLHFRPSEPDKIYLVIGDLAYQQGNASLNYANKLVNPFGKVLRINDDGTIPNDNPFYDDGDPATGNDDRIWSYGHRNPFDFCFSPVTDSLYSSENGWNTWDEVNLIMKGQNYGWAACEGEYLNSSTTQLCTLANDVLPIETWGSLLPAVTGILYYSGQLMPEFDNHLLVADNDVGNIYDLTLGNAPHYDTVLQRTTWMDVTTTGGLTTIQQGADGCVYALKGGYTSNGIIYQICPEGFGMESYETGSVSVAPNPVTNNSIIHYNALKSGDVEIALTDVAGRKAMVVYSGNLSEGEYEFSLSGSHTLSPGTYFCTVTASGKPVKSIKVLVN